METNVRIRTMQILKIMRIVVWVAFIGFMIKAGTVLFAYIVSCYNPEAAHNLDYGINLYDIRNYSFWHYTCVVSFIIALPALKAHVCSLVIKTLEKVNLKNPFKVEVVQLLEKISYLFLGAFVLALINNGYVDWLEKRTGASAIHWDSSEFIFIAGIIFILSQIFKRGVEIQTENELTI